MEGQGQRDQYGNPVRQSSQSYPHGYNIPGQNFAGGYSTQGRGQSQMGGHAQSYGTGQTASQRPDTSGYSYSQSLSYPSQQMQQYGGEFGTDPTRQYASGISSSGIMGYYPSQNVYDASMRQGQMQPPQHIQSHHSMQTEAFPYYAGPSSQYSASPQTPSQLSHYTPRYASQPGRPSNHSPYSQTPIHAGYPSFESSSQMQPPPAQPQPQQQVQPPRPSEGYRVYLRKVRETFEHIHAGRLALGGQTLLDASEALLTRIEELGLTKDDENLQDQRVKMWKNFNLCWLAFMQRLKDTLEEILRTGQQPAQPQSVITLLFLDRMGDKLVAWADSVEVGARRLRDRCLGGRNTRNCY